MRLKLSTGRQLKITVRYDKAKRKGHKGIYTKTLIDIKNEEAETNLANGESSCSPKDQFCKLTGRKLALHDLFDRQTAKGDLEKQIADKQKMLIGISEKYKSLVNKAPDDVIRQQDDLFSALEKQIKLLKEELSLEVELVVFNKQERKEIWQKLCGRLLPKSKTSNYQLLREALVDYAKANKIRNPKKFPDTLIKHRKPEFKQAGK